MTKIVSGLLILRKGNSTEWTPELDAAMQQWTTQYISWLESYPTALRESIAPKFVILSFSLLFPQLNV
jgi:hypothetical protein